MANHRKRFGLAQLALALWAGVGHIVVSALILSARIPLKPELRQLSDGTSEHGPLLTWHRRSTEANKPPFQGTENPLEPRKPRTDSAILDTGGKTHGSRSSGLRELDKRAGGQDKGKGRSSREEANEGDGIDSGVGQSQGRGGGTGTDTPDLAIRPENSIYVDSYRRGAFNLEHLRRPTNTADLSAWGVASNVILQYFKRDQLNPYQTISVAVCIGITGAYDWNSESRSYRPVKIIYPKYSSREENRAEFLALVSAVDGHLILAWKPIWLEINWANWMFLSWMLGSDSTIDNEKQGTIDSTPVDWESSQHKPPSVISIMNIGNPNTLIVLDEIARRIPEYRREVPGTDTSKVVEDASGYLLQHKLVTGDREMSEEDQQMRLRDNDLFLTLYGTAEVTGIRQMLDNFHQKLGGVVIQAIGFAIYRNTRKYLITVELQKPDFGEHSANIELETEGLTTDFIVDPNEFSVSTELLSENGPEHHPFRNSLSQSGYSQYFADYPSYFHISAVYKVSDLEQYLFYFRMSTREQHIVTTSINTAISGESVTRDDIEDDIFAASFKLVMLTTWRRQAGHTPVRHIMLAGDSITEEAKSFLRPYVQDISGGHTFLLTRQEQTDELLRMQMDFAQTREGKMLKYLWSSPEFSSSYVEAFEIGWTSSTNDPFVVVHLGYTGEDEFQKIQIALGAHNGDSITLSPCNPGSGADLHTGLEIQLADLADKLLLLGAEVYAQADIMAIGADLNKPRLHSLTTAWEVADGPALRKNHRSSEFTLSNNPVAELFTDALGSSSPGTTFYRTSSQIRKWKEQFQRFVRDMRVASSFVNFTIVPASGQNGAVYQFSSLPPPTEPRQGNTWTPRCLVLRQQLHGSSPTSCTSLTGALSAAWLTAGFDEGRTLSSHFNEIRAIVFQQVNDETRRILEVVYREYADLRSSETLTLFAYSIQHSTSRSRFLWTMLHGTAEICAAQRMFIKHSNIFGAPDRGNWKVDAIHIHYKHTGTLPVILVLLEQVLFHRLGGSNPAAAMAIKTQLAGIYFDKPWSYTAERGQVILNLEAASLGSRDIHRSTDAPVRPNLEVIQLPSQVNDVVPVLIRIPGDRTEFKFSFDISSELELGFLEAPPFNADPYIEQTYVDDLGMIYLQAWQAWATASRRKKGNEERQPGSRSKSSTPLAPDAIILYSSMISPQTRSNMEQVDSLKDLVQWEHGRGYWYLNQLSLPTLITEGLTAERKILRQIGILRLCMLLGSIEVAGIAAMLRNYPNQLGGRFRIKGISILKSRIDTSQDGLRVEIGL